MTVLTQQQAGLLEKFCRAHAAMNMAVDLADFNELGVAYANALDACLDAGFDPFHHPQPQ